MRMRRSTVELRARVSRYCGTLRGGPEENRTPFFAMPSRHSTGELRAPNKNLSNLANWTNSRKIPDSYFTRLEIGTALFEEVFPEAALVEEFIFLGTQQLIEEIVFFENKTDHQIGEVFRIIKVQIGPIGQISQIRWG